MGAWLNRADCILTRERRKLCATALCGLMITAKPSVLQSTAQIVDVWVSVLMADDYGAERKPSVAPLEIRRRQVQDLGMDQLDLRATVLQCVQQLRVGLGESNYPQLIQSVDPAIMNQ